MKGDPSCREESFDNKLVEFVGKVPGVELVANKSLELVDNKLLEFVDKVSELCCNLHSLSKRLVSKSTFLGICK